MKIPVWLDMANSLDRINCSFFNSYLYDECKTISNNGISIVMLHEELNMVYKMSIPFLIENEIYCLKKLHETGIVPHARKYDKYTIAMDYLGATEKVKNRARGNFFYAKVETALKKSGIRHGDLAPPNIIIKDDRIYILDFAESRLHGDTRPNKKGRDPEMLGQSLAEMMR